MPFELLTMPNWFRSLKLMRCKMYETVRRLNICRSTTNEQFLDAFETCFCTQVYRSPSKTILSMLWIVWFCLVGKKCSIHKTTAAKGYNCFSLRNKQQGNIKMLHSQWTLIIYHATFHKGYQKLETAKSITSNQNNWNKWNECTCRFVSFLLPSPLSHPSFVNARPCNICSIFSVDILKTRIVRKTPKWKVNDQTLCFLFW